MAQTNYLLHKIGFVDFLMQTTVCKLLYQFNYLRSWACNFKSGTTFIHTMRALSVTFCNGGRAVGCPVNHILIYFANLLVQKILQTLQQLL